MHFRNREVGQILSNETAAFQSEPSKKYCSFLQLSSPPFILTNLSFRNAKIRAKVEICQKKSKDRLRDPVF